MPYVGRLSINRLFDPRNLDQFRIEDLETILVLNGFYPSREDIEQAERNYGELASNNSRKSLKRLKYKKLQNSMQLLTEWAHFPPINLKLNCPMKFI